MKSQFSFLIMFFYGEKYNIVNTKKQIKHDLKEMSNILIGAC